MPGYSKSLAQRFTVKWRPVQTSAPVELKTVQKRFAEKQEIPIGCKNKRKKY